MLSFCTLIFNIHLFIYTHSISSKKIISFMYQRSGIFCILAVDNIGNI